MSDTKKTANYTAIETPVLLTGYNFLSAPSPLSKDFYIDVILDTSNPDEHTFIETLKKIHESNVSLEMDSGGGNNKVRDVNIKPLTEEDKEKLLPESTAVLENLVKIRFKSKFAPTIISASGVKRTMKKNLPAGAKIRLKGKAASYKNNGHIGTTFYVSLVQLSPMEDEEINEEVTSEGFSSPWPK